MKDRDENINEMKQWFINSDFKDFEILSVLPHRYRIEKMIIEKLKSTQGTDFLGSIMALPRNSRELYPHAFQSYLWNRVASERIKIFGNKVQQNDLIEKDGHFILVTDPA